MSRSLVARLVVLPFLSLLVQALRAEQPALIQSGGAKIDVTLPDSPMKLTREELLGWVKSCADSVSQYYGRFPVRHLTLEIRSGRGSGIRHGMTYPLGGGLIHISVGDQTGIGDLNDDWVLTHEMIHLAFPNMADNHHWIEEGLATYVEPIARARAGRLAVAEVWKEFLRDMPKGEPEDGDQGLDNTPTWGRTYWGGAMFCLLADVEIRRQTKNRKGLEDALRAIVNSGGDITQDWSIEKALSAGDKGTGTTVLRSLYQKMGDQPSPVDLEQLWKKLGVQVSGDGAVRFDDNGPEANIRRAITAK